jgi:hypothetical protein
MSLQDASDLINISHAKAELARDDSLTFWGRMKAIESIDAAAELRDQGPMVTVSDVIKGAVGAGLGYGVGAAVGAFLGFSPATKSNLKLLGAGLGTLMNTGILGMNKTSEAQETERDIRNAVRLGFLKGAHDSGLLRNPRFLKHGFLALTPETIAAPVKAVSGVTSGLGTAGGATAATIFGDDEADEDISKIMLEKRLMERQADRIRQQRKNKIIAGMLGRRTQGVTNTTRY